MKKRKCNSCGHVFYGEAKFCEVCGKSLALTVCRKCGKTLSDGSRICGECKCTKGVSYKRNIIILVVVAALLLVGGIVSIAVFGGGESQGAADTLTLAQRYLDEQNYEQAIIEFDRVLAIDELNADAYLGKAEALLALGRINEAIETLEYGYEKTADERLLDMLDELRASQTTSATSVTIPTEAPTVTEEPVEETDDGMVELVWSDIDGNMTGEGFGHYTMKDGELYGFTDINGNFLNDDRYAAVYGFDGNEKENYAIVATMDGRYIIVDKDLNETMDCMDASSIYIFNDEDPYVLCKGYTDGLQYVNVYHPDGTLVYQWNPELALDGSGATLTLDDPIVPQELLTMECSTEYHDKLWIDEFEVTIGDHNLYAVNDDIYVNFGFDIGYAYDNTAELAAWEAQDAAAAAQGGVHITSHNTHGHSQYGYALCRFVCDEDGVSLELLNKEHMIGISYSYEIVNDDYSIGFSRVPTSEKAKVLERDGKLSYWTYDNNPYEAGFINFGFISDERMWRGRVNKESDTNEYALYIPDWHDEQDWYKELVGESSDYSDYDAYLKAKAEVMYGGSEQLSEWYDLISWTSAMTELGYYGVELNGRCGLISIATGEELCMYDDMSDFINGYAVVCDDGTGYIIDGELNIVSESFPCDGCETIDGNTYLIFSDDEYRLLTLK